jgi:N-methylhydantoinase B
MSNLVQQPDAATINIVTNALHGIAEEMGVNLLRSARSTIIREARDCSCALLDRQGRLIAEADHAPIQMSSLALPLEACLRRHPISELVPGDIFLTNDPYEGGQHLQDLILFLPVFDDGVVVGFAGSVAHHIDIGGGSAGLTLDAAEIYSEGLRFTCLRLHECDFDEDGLVPSVVFSNFREPYTSMGDLRAQLAACVVGRDRLLELARRFGQDALDSCIDALLRHSETLMRNAIREIPDGTYKAHDQVDGDVLDNQPIGVALTMTVQGDEMTLDFTGTDLQTHDFLNVPIASTLAAALSAVTMFAASGGRRIPANEGCHRPVSVESPAGTFLNPLPPAAVRARMCGAYRTFDCVLMALQQALPSRAPALGFNVNTTVGFSRSTDAGFRIFIEDIGGGWGATPHADGQDMLDAPLSNCKITPVEMLELDHPHLRLVRYEFLPNSGGDGQHRGGLGTVREYEVLDDGVSFFAYADRHRFQPRGVLGGRDGRPGAFKVLSQGQVSSLPSKTACTVGRGDHVVVIAGGGGGYGAPEDRAESARSMDRLLGKVIETQLTEGEVAQ